jgi:hypothetical protein
MIMFNVSEWLKSALIEGVKNGTLAREFVVTKAVDYLSKNILTELQVQEIAVAIEPAPVEEVVDEPEVPSE